MYHEFIYYLSGNETYELRYFSLFSMISKGLKKYEEMYMKEYGNAPKDNIGTQEIEEKRIDSLEEAGPVLRMNSGDKRYAGYTNKYFVAYIIIMTICIGIILGAAIFKILH